MLAFTLFAPAMADQGFEASTAHVAARELSATMRLGWREHARMAERGHGGRRRGQGL
jgi:hypothetical protein